MNPAMSQINRTIEKTPHGYPTMPGYQVGNSGASQPYGTSQPYQGSSTTSTAGNDPYYQQGQTPMGYQPPTQDGTYDMSQYEQAYAGRSADAVDRGQITMDDVVVKTGILFTLTVAMAAVTWVITGINPQLASLLTTGGAIGGLVFALINIFKKQTSPGLIIAYAACEGLFLGGISALFEMIIPGIVFQAVMATLIVFAVTLTLYKMKVLRNTPRLQRFTLIGLISVMLFFIGSFVYSLVTKTSLMAVTIFGLPLGLIVGLICIGLAITSLIGDFDIAEKAVEAGMPRVFAWYCAFGIMVTLIWLYINILRVLAYINEMQR